VRDTTESTGSSSFLSFAAFLYPNREISKPISPRSSP
jgi:hypothetical protein